uniref:LRAT domain-containing protein n=1 Tax=Parastrongyloides trichosuri TaxID=131310 RepID=A0A0N4ZP54_PARTI
MIHLIILFLSLVSSGLTFKNHLGWLTNKTIQFDDSYYTSNEISTSYIRSLRTDTMNPKDLKKFLKPGDMIEFENGILGGSVPYSHWGIFLGIIEEKHIIIHVARESNYFSNEEGEKKSSRITIHLTDLENSGFNGMMAKINNFLDRALLPNSVELIRKNAMIALDRDAKYDLVQNNCEHFATELRYSRRFSMQVESRYMIMNSFFIFLCTGLTFWINKTKSDRIVKEIHLENSKKIH